MRRGAAWGLALTDGRRLDHVPANRVPAVARAGAAPLFQQWRADAADARAPAGGGRGSEERGCGRAWTGSENRGVGRAQMNSNI
jgi:hypothetical protein